MRRGEAGQSALIGGTVRLPQRADLPVAPRLSGAPFDGVVSVRALVGEGIELALRLVAAPDILRDRDIASLGVE